MHVHQAAVLLLAATTLVAFTALITWQLARQPAWYTLEGNTVVLDASVQRVAPASTWRSLRSMRLPTKFGALKVVLGATPVSVTLSTRAGDLSVLQLAYTPDGGLALVDVRRDETIVRYDPDLGFLIGDGTPDARYLQWVQTQFRTQHPFQTPVLLIGAAHTEIVNNLQLLSRVQLDEETYVARAHHTHSPAYSGMALVRNGSTIFLADNGPVLINNVPWASVQANVDAAVVAGGTVVTIDALQLDTGGASIMDDPGDLVVTVRRWSQQTTCTSFRNLNDAVVLEQLEPGELFSPDLIRAIEALDLDAYEFVAQANQATTSFRLARSPVCDLQTGTIHFEAHVIGQPPQPLAFETQPVMCSADGWQIVCQGRNAFLSSIAA